VFFFLTSNDLVYYTNTLQAQKQCQQYFSNIGPSGLLHWCHTPIQCQ